MSSNHFSNFLECISSKPLRVFDASIPNSKYVGLDLSEDNKALELVNMASSSSLAVYIENYIKEHDALIAYGGYNETRNIYKRSRHFNNQEVQEERNIHLGIDLWCEAGSLIYAPLDGKVHSFKNNDNYGDYGPTIVLEHQIMGVTFYTLYGHLSLVSIENIKGGQYILQGGPIARLGSSAVNGDYPSHLHFQIIEDIRDFKGDYPGVCSKSNLAYYLNNCPNPEVLLKLNL